MTYKDLLKQKAHFINLVVNRELQEAFQRIRGISESLMFWELTDSIISAEAGYRMMLDYAVNGNSDPERGIFVDKVAEELINFYQIILLRQKIVENAYEIQVNKAREFKANGRILNEILDEYNTLKVNNDINSVEVTALEQEIFYFVWTALNFTHKDYSTLLQLYRDNYSSKSLLTLIISALLLRAMQLGYSTAILNLLLDIYDTDIDNEWRIKALVAAVIIMNFYNRLIPIDIVNTKINKIIESHGDELGEDIRIVINELLRSLETDRINQKMRDDIIPTMMKMGPEIRERFKDLGEDEIIDMEGNPEWEEMFEKSGLADKLMELNRLQQEGADVMMGTFGPLKSFPFFNDVHAWFLPFSVKRPEVAQLIKDFPALKKLLSHSHILCDSDLFSFVFSMSSLPAAARMISLKNAGDQFEAMNEMMGDNEDATQSTKTIANRYVRNLYRFFKLYRRKDEFIDPFFHLKNPVNVGILKRFLSDKKNILTIAEYYFKQEIWDEAAEAFTRLEEIGEISVSVYQKLGFCYQKRDDFARAIDCYLFAETLENDSVWTLKKIAYCARRLGRWNTAIEYYGKLIKLGHDDYKTAMTLGKCHMELSQYRDAVRCFYKAYYLEPQSNSALKGIIKALLYAGDIEGIEKNISKLTSFTEDYEAFVLMGHFLFLKNDYQRAIDNYVEALKIDINRKEELLKEIKGEIKIMASNVDPLVVQLILEALKYREN